MTGKRLVALALSAVLATASTATAQDKYPSKPITMIVPFAAGGPTDVLSRIVSERMGAMLGQQVVVENVGGAGGATGAQRAMRAAPDGYTIIMGTLGSHAQSQLLREKPLYDPRADFVPVSLIADVPLVLVVKKDLPVTDLKSFSSYAKANQKTMTFGSSGVGAPLHIAAVLLNSSIGATEIAHVPYRGSGPALNDLVAGKIDYIVDTMSTVKPLVEGGQIKAIAVMQSKRSPSLPNVPTAEEQGMQGVNAYTWNGILLPKGAPADVVKLLNETAIKAANDPTAKKKLEELGYTVTSAEQATPEYFGKFIAEEITKWSVPIKAAGIKVDQ